MNVFVSSRVLFQRMHSLFGNTISPTIISTSKKCILPGLPPFGQFPVSNNCAIVLYVTLPRIAGRWLLSTSSWIWWTIVRACLAEYTWASAHDDFTGWLVWGVATCRWICILKLGIYVARSFPLPVRKPPLLRTPDENDAYCSEVRLKKEIDCSIFYKGALVMAS